MPIREQAQEPRGRPIHEWAVPVHESAVPIYELDLAPGGTIHELVLFSASSCSVPKYQCPSSKWQFLCLGTPEKSTEREQDSEIRTRSYSGTSSCMGKSHLCTGNFYVWVLTQHTPTPNTHTATPEDKNSEINRLSNNSLIETRWQ